MAVTGLPAAVSNILTTLLSNDHHVTSWKVTGEGDNSVVILRLSATQPGVAPLHTTGQWRRKPPGQVRRDQQRAARHRLQHMDKIATTTANNLRQGDDDNDDLGSGDGVRNDYAIGYPTTENDSSRFDTGAGMAVKGRIDKHDEHSQASDFINHRTSPLGLFMPSPTPTLISEWDTQAETARKNAVGLTVDTHEHSRAAYVSVNMSDPTQMCCDLPAQTTTEDLYDISIDSNGETSEMTSIEQLLSERGYVMENVKTVVAGLTNKIKQSHLRQVKRNTAFKKTVLDTRGSNEIIICDSDDYVFTYDCKQQICSWFIKVYDGQMSQEDRDTLSCLRKWDAIDTDPYKEYCDVLLEDMACVSRAVRYLMG